MTTLSSLLPPVNISTASGTLPAANGGTGLTAPGTAGNLLTSDGTGWISAAPPASGPSLEAIASGSLSDGSTVIVNADGTVSVVLGEAQALGTPVVFESATTANISATYDANAQKVVIAYRDDGNSSFATAIVGTVSGTTISFGTPVVFRSFYTQDIYGVYDENAQKIVIIFKNQASQGGAIVGTVSGTSISFGSATVIDSERAIFGTAVYHAVAQKFVFAYRSLTTGNGIAFVATISGTSFSTGSSVVFSSGAASNISAAYDAAAEKVVLAYEGASAFGRSRVGTISGTSISFGTEVVFESASISNSSTSTVYDASAQKIVISYRDVGNSSFGTVIVGTVSGTTISFGTAVVFESASTDNISATYDANAQKVVIAYRDNGNSSFGTSLVFKNEILTNLTAENFIGFSDGAYTNGQTATVQIVSSVDDAQSGLTAGQSYFVQLDGTLGLSPATPSVFAGTAVSASKIIVKG